jgi:hypothetical protein
MTVTLLWDEGPGEVRLGLIENGALTEFRLIRPRHPERALAAAGELYTARIVRRMSGGRALATLGFGDDVIVQPAPTAPEGSLIAVEMVRAAIPEPGRWKRAVVRPVKGPPDREPGWRFSREPWETALFEHGARVDAVLCADAATAAGVERTLGAAAPAVRVDPEAIDDADFDGLIEAAMLGSFPIPEGAISIERTRAMTMIDIDGEADGFALNRAAALELPRLLRLFDIGGPVGVDFVSMASRTQRAEIDRLLAQGCAALGPHERTAINGFGFCQIIRPRIRPSVAEILCETTPGRLSVESKAIALLRAAGRSQGVGARRLAASPAVIDFIRERPHEIAALRFALGAEVALVPDATATGYGHVHVAQS